MIAEVRRPRKVPVRRSPMRFAVELDVKYREVSRRPDNQEGAGKTINIGADGLLFTTQHSLRLGARVQLSLSWPVLLDGRTPLRLVQEGVVRWANERCAAVAVQRYEFRTSRTPSTLLSGGARRL
jgi:hypothetical protein